MKRINTPIGKLILICFLAVYAIISFSPQASADAYPKVNEKNRPSNMLLAASDQDLFHYSDQIKGKFVEAGGILEKKIDYDRLDIFKSRFVSLILLYKNGEYQKAEKIYKAIVPSLHSNTLKTITLNNLAVVLYAEGKYNEAEKYIREALETNEAHSVEFDGKTSNHEQIGSLNPSVLLHNFEEITNSLGQNLKFDPLYQKVKADQRGIIFTNDFLEMLKIEF